MDKVKQAAKDLRKLQKEGKDDKDPKVAEATTKLQNAIQEPINDASHTGWTTNGHTGEDVNTYAYGQDLASLKATWKTLRVLKTSSTFSKMM